MAGVSIARGSGIRRVNVTDRVVQLGPDHFPAQLHIFAVHNGILFRLRVVIRLRGAVAVHCGVIVIPDHRRQLDILPVYQTIDRPVQSVVLIVLIIPLYRLSGIPLVGGGLGAGQLHMAVVPVQTVERAAGADRLREAPVRLGPGGGVAHGLIGLRRSQAAVARPGPDLVPQLPGIGGGGRSDALHRIIRVAALVKHVILGAVVHGRRIVLRVAAGLIVLHPNQPPAAPGPVVAIGDIEDPIRSSVVHVTDGAVVAAAVAPAVVCDGAALPRQAHIVAVPLRGVDQGVLLRDGVRGGGGVAVTEAPHITVALPPGKAHIFSVDDAVLFLWVVCRCYRIVEGRLRPAGRVGCVRVGVVEVDRHQIAVIVDVDDGALVARNGAVAHLRRPIMEAGILDVLQITLHRSIVGRIQLHAPTQQVVAPQVVQRHAGIAGHHKGVLVVVGLFAVLRALAVGDLLFPDDDRHLGVVNLLPMGVEGHAVGIGQLLVNIEPPVLERIIGFAVRVVVGVLGEVGIDDAAILVRDLNAVDPVAVGVPGRRVGVPALEAEAGAAAGGQLGEEILRRAVRYLIGVVRGEEILRADIGGAVAALSRAEIEPAGLREDRVEVHGAVALIGLGEVPEADGHIVTVLVRSAQQLAAVVVTCGHFLIALVTALPEIARPSCKNFVGRVGTGRGDIADADLRQLVAAQHRQLAGQNGIGNYAGFLVSQMEIHKVVIFIDRREIDVGAALGVIGGHMGPLIDGPGQLAFSVAVSGGVAQGNGDGLLHEDQLRVLVPGIGDGPVRRHAVLRHMDDVPAVEIHLRVGFVGRVFDLLQGLAAGDDLAGLEVVVRVVCPLLGHVGEGVGTGGKGASALAVVRAEEVEGHARRLRRRIRLMLQDRVDGESGGLKGQSPVSQTRRNQLRLLSKVDDRQALRPGHIRQLQLHVHHRAGLIFRPVLDDGEVQQLRLSQVPGPGFQEPGCPPEVIGIFRRPRLQGHGAQADARRQAGVVVVNHRNAVHHGGEVRSLRAAGGELMGVHHLGLRAGPVAVVGGAVGCQGPVFRHIAQLGHGGHIPAVLELRRQGGVIGDGGGGVALLIQIVFGGDEGVIARQVLVQGRRRAGGEAAAAHGGLALVDQLIIPDRGFARKRDAADRARHRAGVIRALHQAHGVAVGHRAARRVAQEAARRLSGGGGGGIDEIIDDAAAFAHQAAGAALRRDDVDPGRQVLCGLGAVGAVLGVAAGVAAPDAAAGEAAHQAAGAALHGADIDRRGALLDAAAGEAAHQAAGVAAVGGGDLPPGVIAGVAHQHAGHVHMLQRSRQRAGVAAVFTIDVEVLQGQVPDAGVVGLGGAAEGAEEAGGSLAVHGDAADGVVLPVVAGQRIVHGADGQIAALITQQDGPRSAGRAKHGVRRRHGAVGVGPGITVGQFVQIVRPDQVAGLPGRGDVHQIAGAVVRRQAQAGDLVAEVLQVADVGDFRLGGRGGVAEEAVGGDRAAGNQAAAAGGEDLDRDVLAGDEARVAADVPEVAVLARHVVQGDGVGLGGRVIFDIGQDGGGAEGDVHARPAGRARHQQSQAGVGVVVVGVGHEELEPLRVAIGQRRGLQALVSRHPLRAVAAVPADDGVVVGRGGIVIAAVIPVALPQVVGDQSVILLTGKAVAEAAAGGGIEHVQDDGRVGLIADHIAAALADGLVHRGKGQHQPQQAAARRVGAGHHRSAAVRGVGADDVVIDAGAVAVRVLLLRAEAGGAQEALALRRRQVVLRRDKDLPGDAVLLHLVQPPLVVDDRDKADPRQNDDDRRHHQQLHQREAPAPSFMFKRMFHIAHPNGL